MDEKKKERLVSIAQGLESHMKDAGFCVGVFSRGLSARFTPNGKYQLSFGYAARGDEDDFIHHGTSQTLGLRYPVSEVDFTYIESSRLQGSSETKEEIVAGFSRFSEIEFDTVNPEITVLKEAYSIVTTIENWFEQNGTPVTVKNGRLKNPYVLNKSNKQT